ncbi:hypothetical protein [Paenibacillus kribbensis]|uniref:hypothetical protein n=1 Tax=Paenibacillus kribbensis TaxID=172713 RepID=UPI00210A96EA|nr:hypothetical protein [Paenibacillus kribbensis]
MEMKGIAQLIGLALKNPKSSTVKEQIFGKVREINFLYMVDCRSRKLEGDSSNLSE